MANDRRSSWGALARAIWPALWLLIPASSTAWDNHTTHRQITDQAVQLLQKTNGLSYRELTPHQSDISDGAEQEDNYSFSDEVWGNYARVIYHFYNPRTGQGFGYNELLQPISPPNESAWDLGREIWNRALQEYRDGQKAKAYRFLGRAAHLLTGDASQAAHVHDDPHAPFLLGGDNSPSEDYAATPEGLSFLSADNLSKIEGENYSTPDEFIINLSRLAYETSRWKGSAEYQFPGYIWAGSRFIPMDSVSRKPWDLVREKQIDHLEAYATKTLYCNPQYYRDLKPSEYNQDFWVINPEENKFDSGTYYYIDRFDDFYVDSADFGTRPGSEYVTRKLAGPSIQYTAGLIKLFAKKVDPYPPVVTLTDSQGNLIANGEAMQDNTLVVQARDPADFSEYGDYPTASGI